MKTEESKQLMSPTETNRIARLEDQDRKSPEAPQEEYYTQVSPKASTKVSPRTPRRTTTLTKTGAAVIGQAPSIRVSQESMPPFRNDKV